MSSEIFKRLNLRGFQVGKQIQKNQPRPSASPNDFECFCTASAEDCLMKPAAE